MKNKSKIINLIIMIIFVSLTLFISFYHENWRDEVQAYLLCRDMNFFDLVKNIHFEGHPFFYYLIIYPFVKLGFNMKIVNIFSLIFVYISAWLLLYKTDLKIYNKLFILFSYPFLYEYSVIGRSYSLIILLFIIIAVLFKDRKRNAIFIGIFCGLLLNTHLLVSGFVLSIFLFFYLYELLFNRKNNSLSENKSIFYGFIIICIFGMILLIQFIPIFFNGIALKTNSNFSFNSIIKNLYLILFCFDIKNSFILFGVLLLFVMYFFMLFKENKFIFFSIIFNIIYFSCICSYLFNIILIHYSYLLFIYIFFYSIINNNKSNFILAVLFIFTFKYSILLYYNDYMYSYSSAEEVYNYIEKNVDKNSLIATVDSANSETILGYSSNYKFYDLKSNRYFTYIIWDKKRYNTNINYDYFDNEILSGRDTYFILSYKDNVCDFSYYVLEQVKNKYNIKLVFSTASNETIVKDEKYELYKISLK